MPVGPAIRAGASKLPGAVSSLFGRLKGLRPEHAKRAGIGALEWGAGVPRPSLWRRPSSWPYLGLAAQWPGRPIAESVVESSLGTEEWMNRALGEIAKENRTRRLLTQSRMEGLRRSMMESAAKLAAIDPHLYNQVLAGRRLPQGAVVFGGQPRTDLLEELAYDMASGAYNQPDPQQELLDLLGA